MSLYDLVYTNKGQRFYLGGEPEDYNILPVEVAISCVSTSAKNSNNIEIIQIPFKDSFYVDELPSIQTLKRWLKIIHLLINERDVYFHCYAGMNRSALILTLYMMEYYMEEFGHRNEIVSYLKSKRSPILQNSHFERIINDWRLEEPSSEFKKMKVCTCNSSANFRTCPLSSQINSGQNYYCYCCEIHLSECKMLCEEREVEIDRIFSPS